MWAHPNDLILTISPKILFPKNRSHSQVLEVKFSTYPFGGYNSTHNKWGRQYFKWRLWLERTRCIWGTEGRDYILRLRRNMIQVNKCTKKQIVKIPKYIVDYSHNLWLNVSDIHEGMHSILEAMVGRLCDEMDSARMSLSFWASQPNLLAILIWSSNLLFKLCERKILDLIETQAICHLWGWNTDLRCCMDWNFKWYQSLREFKSLAWYKICVLKYLENLILLQ